MNDSRERRHLAGTLYIAAGRQDGGAPGDKCAEVKIGREQSMNKNRVVLAGGSGFIGRTLAKELLARDYEVVVLTRSPRKRTDGVKEILWDGKNPGEWIQSLDGAETVVNLAGRNIKCRYMPENLRELTASRVD